MWVVGAKYVNDAYIANLCSTVLLCTTDANRPRKKDLAWCFDTSFQSEAMTWHM